MRNHMLISLIVLFMIILITGNASADLVDHGLYTYDDSTGLWWLDVSQTVGMSWGYVDSQLGEGGLFEGWRFASGAEYDALVTGLGGTPDQSSTPRYDNFSKQPLALAQSIFETIGNTYHDTSVGGTTFVLGYISDYKVQDSTIIHYSSLVQIYYNEPDYTAFGTYFGEGDSDTVQGWVASYLVSEVNPVPIPPSILLLGSGLIGLVGFRRKYKK